MPVETPGPYPGVCALVTAPSPSPGSTVTATCTPFPPRGAMRARTRRATPCRRPVPQETHSRGARRKARQGGGRAGPASCRPERYLMCRTLDAGEPRLSGSDPVRGAAARRPTRSRRPGGGQWHSAGHAAVPSPGPPSSDRRRRSGASRARAAKRRFRARARGDYSLLAPSGPAPDAHQIGPAGWPAGPTVRADSPGHARISAAAPRGRA